MFLFNELADELLLIDEILDLRLVLIGLLLHDEDGLVRSILDVLVLDVFEHHIESILNIVLGSARHLLDDFGPLVANAQSFLQDQDVLLQAEGILLDLRVQEVDPSFSALFTVAADVQTFVELRGDLAPLFGTVRPDEPHELLVLSLDPVALLDGRLLVLVELVLALRIITPRNERGNLNPIVFVQLLRRYSLSLAVLEYGPLEQFGLVIGPVLFGVIRLLALDLLKLVEYLGRRVIIDGNRQVLLGTLATVIVVIAHIYVQKSSWLLKMNL